MIQNQKAEIIDINLPLKLKLTCAACNKEIFNSATRLGFDKENHKKCVNLYDKIEINIQWENLEVKY